jgi:hypothetical protein
VHNILASVALLGFIPFAIVVFSRLPRATAAAFVVLSGSLFLPEYLAFNLPAVPPLDKEGITYLGALAGGIAYHSRKLAIARPGAGFEMVFLLIVCANVGTVLVNGGAVYDERRWEPGLDFYDVISQSAQALLSFALPFFVGRALFSGRDDLRALLVMIAVAGVVYTGLILVEVVLSIPFRVFQLSTLFYGFSPGVSYRWGGIQPQVFLDNGLSVATFMATSCLAIAGLGKAKLPFPVIGPKKLWPVLAAGLFMTRNVAGNVYGITLGLAIFLFKPKKVAAAALALGLLVATYPSLRMADLFPYQKILDLAGRFDAGRERSLEGRFYEEQYVVDMIGDRFWFGWGNISRVPGAEGLLYGIQEDAFEGGLDGFWIIDFGIHGAVGLALRLSFLLVPILLAWRRMSLLRSAREQALLATLMAIVAMRATDLLVNGWWNDLPAFLAGTLYAFARTLGTERTRVRRAPLPEPLAAAPFSAARARRADAPR